MAGGLAFNILLALVPFVLLLIAGIGFLLGNRPQEAMESIATLLSSLLPNGSESVEDLLRRVLSGVLETRGAVTLYSAVGFAWFSTRLFGSLRSVLALVFDDSDRSLVFGKLFDLLATLIATLAAVVYVVFNAYLGLATTRGLAVLRELGVRESSMGGLAYFWGRLISMLVVFLLFYALYRGLPRKRPPVRKAAVGGLVAVVLLEIARNLFAIVIRQADPSSLYTGTIAVVVSVVFWTYYGAFLFLIGAEVAQAWWLRQVDLRARLRHPIP